MSASLEPLSKIVALLFLLLLCFSAPAAAGPTRINAVIGDESWTALEGSPSSSDEVARIRTHLLFVHDRLREADTSYLTVDQRQRRARALDDLGEYAEAGVFPQRAPDDGYLGRRPRFIDDRGVHCAVGELIRRSGEPQLAQSIDDRWEYAFVEEIHSPRLAAWSEAHGFDARELAMIQPMYAPTDPTERFIYNFILLFIFVGWAGFLCSFLLLVIARIYQVFMSLDDSGPRAPGIGVFRLMLVALGGWVFCTLFMTASPDLATTPINFLVLVVAQLAYTWVGYQIVTRFRPRNISPAFMSQRAMLAEALAEEEAGDRWGGFNDYFGVENGHGTTHMEKP